MARKKRQKKTKLTMMMVEWGDAWSGGTWVSRAYANDQTTAPVRVFSVGWLMHANRKGLYLAARIDEDNEEIGNRMFIPRGMIISTKILTAGRLVKKA